MSLHINLTESAEHAIVVQKRKNMATATSSAILAPALIAVLLYISAVIIPPVIKPQITALPTIDPVEHTNPTPPKPEKPISRPPTNPSPANAVILSTTPDTTHIPPNIMFETPDRVNVIGNDLPINNGPIPSQSQKEPGMGVPSIDEAGGSALAGTFYDLKQFKNGSPTNMSTQQVAEELQRFVNGNWNERMLDKYYKSPTKLFTTQIYISRRSATEAPKAFQCEDKVQDSRWCAIYRGNVTAPVSGKFRFVGVGDDALVVRFNNENVFDYGWYQLTLGKTTNGKEWMDVMKGKTKNAGITRELKGAKINIPPVQFYEYSSTGHWNNSVGGLACGKTFEVMAGEVYPIEILISELPGGEFGAALLIEQIDVSAEKKDAKTGAPLLPLFKTQWVFPEQIKGKDGNFVPFDQIGPIWETVQ